MLCDGVRYAHLPAVEAFPSFPVRTRRAGRHLFVNDAHRDLRVKRRRVRIQPKGGTDRVVEGRVIEEQGAPLGRLGSHAT